MITVHKSTNLFITLLSAFDDPTFTATAKLPWHLLALGICHHLVPAAFLDVPRRAKALANSPVKELFLSAPN